MKRFATIVMLSACTCIGAHAGCRGGPIVHLRVSAEGTVFWNGIALKDRQELADKFREAATAKEQPEIHLDPSLGANYTMMVEVLTEAQKAGAHCLGFTGLAQEPQD